MLAMLRRMSSTLNERTDSLAAGAGRATACALGAIALWSTLAALGVRLSHVPPFLLTGLALIVGSIPAWRRWRQWRVSALALALGVYGLFGFHWLLFMAVRHAPPVQANLVNYLWPLLIVVLAPLVLPAVKLRARHVIAALAGLAGAALAIASGRGLSGGLEWGYALALGSAFVWATYSLGTRRLADTGRGFSTSAVGLFALVSGVLSLLCHLLLEPRTALASTDLAWIVVMGLGPLGAAFYLWDYAFKHGDPRRIGVLSYITPLASTALLIATTGRPFTIWIGAAAALIVGAALVAMRGPSD
jgi:drug/metabolite transporter (DMT)-like permease